VWIIGESIPQQRPIKEKYVRERMIADKNPRQRAGPLHGGREIFSFVAAIVNLPQPAQQMEILMGGFVNQHLRDLHRICRPRHKDDPWGVHPTTAPRPAMITPAHQNTSQHPLNPFQILRYMPTEKV